MIAAKSGANIDITSLQAVTAITPDTSTKALVVKGSSTSTAGTIFEVQRSSNLPLVSTNIGSFGGSLLQLYGQANTRLDIQAFDGGSGIDSICQWDLMPISNGQATFRFFRTTNTAGIAALQVCRGDGSTNVNTQIAANTSSYLNALVGNVGVGTGITPLAKLQVTGGVAISSTTDAATDPGAGNLNVGGNANVSGNLSGSRIASTSFTPFPAGNIIDVNANLTAYRGQAGTGAGTPGDVSIETAFAAAAGTATTQGHSSRIYIKGGTGNVGIATTTPGAKLQVNGGVAIGSSTAAATDPGAGNLSVSGGLLSLNGTGANLLSFPTSGTQPPTLITRSPGTKIVLYPNVDATSTDYAIRIETNNIWSSVPNASQGFKWYAGNTLIASLGGTGLLNANSARAGRYQANYSSTSYSYQLNALDQLESAALLDRGDTLGWKAPVRAEYFDDATSTWVTWTNPPDFKTITNGKTNGIVIDFVRRRFRLVYTGLAHSRSPYFVVEQAFSEKSFTFTVEQSADDITYTASSIPTQTFTTPNASYVIKTDVGYAGNNFARITFDFSSGITSSAINAILVNLKLITYRATDQSPGWQSLFPYDWDSNKNIGINAPIPGAKLQIGGGVAITANTTQSADPGAGNLSVAGRIQTGGLKVGARIVTANTTINPLSSL